MSRLAAYGYYRLTVASRAPWRDGPELIVANHTNSFLDVACVVLGSGRRVRFMTKAPLFDHPRVGWLVKAVGSVPVYRLRDNPKLVSRNLDVFRDVYTAIAEGAAVGIFPEGKSHNSTDLQPLKTGAARIALGAAAVRGCKAFPIVPVGIAYRDRAAFRSPAHVVVGAAPVWDDLAARGADDKEAVRELTRRIERVMQDVTRQLHAWQDAQLVQIASAVWSAEFDAPDEPADQVARLATATAALARFRLGDGRQWQDAAKRLQGHERVLRRSGLTPDSLGDDVSLGRAAIWLMKRLHLILLAPITALGLAVFRIPREITRAVTEKSVGNDSDDLIPSVSVISGGAIFPVWFMLVGLIVGAGFGWFAGLLTFISLPVLAFGAMAISESRRFNYQTIRRYFALRRQPVRVARLRQRQRALALEMQDLLTSDTSG